MAGSLEFDQTVKNSTAVGTTIHAITQGDNRIEGCRLDFVQDGLQGVCVAMNVTNCN